MGLNSVVFFRLEPLELSGNAKSIAYPVGDNFRNSKKRLFSGGG